MSDTPNDDEGGEKVVRLDKVRENLSKGERKGKGKKGPPKGTKPPQPDELPPDCPVKALGYYSGFLHYLSLDGTVHAYKAAQINWMVIVDIFNGTAYLKETWRDFGVAGEEYYLKDNWNHARAAEALVTSAKRQPWNPAEKKRGLGGWIDELTGKFMFHCGAQLVFADGVVDTGMRGDLVYERLERVSLPDFLNARASIGAEQAAASWREEEWSEIDGPGAWVMRKLSTWNMRRPLVDQMLVLGHLISSMYGGAQKFVPMVLLTGETETGKSHVLDGYKYILGKGWFESSGDITVAALQAKLSNSALPMLIDEFEVSDDNSKNEAVFRALILASTGESRDRGSTNNRDVQSIQFRSAFTLAAIAPPGMRPQEKNRIEIIEFFPLANLNRGVATTEYCPVWGSIRECAKIGDQLRARLLKQSFRYHPTHAAIHKALIAAGHGGRDADRLSALLTGYDLAMFDGLSDARIEGYIKIVPVTRVAEGEKQSATQHDFSRHVLSSAPPIYKSGMRETIDTLLAQARRDVERNNEKSPAAEQLATVGIVVSPRTPAQLIRLQAKGVPIVWEIGIAYTHKGFEDLMKGSVYENKGGRQPSYLNILKRDSSRTDDKPIRERLSETGAMYRMQYVGWETWME